MIDGHAEQCREVFKGDPHMAGKRGFDSLPDIRIDFEVLRFGVGEAAAGLIQLRLLARFLRSLLLAALLRNKANFGFTLFGSDL